MVRKVIFSFVIFLLSIGSECLAMENRDSEELKKYVRNLIDDGYAIVNDKSLSDDEIVAKSRELIAANLHAVWMAKYTLGRNRKMLSPDKLKDFIDVYSNFIVSAYASLARNYNGEKVVMKGVRQIDDQMFMVTLEFVKQNGQPPAKIEYLVHKVVGNKLVDYKVADVISGGVSLLNSQQSEFNSVISTSGIDALINSLRQKVADKNKKS